MPVPGKVDPKGLSVHAAMEAGMKLRIDDKEARCFTTSEVLLYQHAQESGPQVCLIIYYLPVAYA